VTASQSKHQADTAQTPADSASPLPSAETQSGPDFSLHKASETAASPSDTSPPVAPAKDEGRKRIPAFVMGLLGGLCVAATLALLALILNPLADVTERLSSIESTVAGMATRRAVETNDKRLVALEGRVDALRTEVEAINRMPAGQPSDLAPLKTQLAHLEQALGLLQQDSVKSGKSGLALTLAQDAARLTLALVVTDKIEQGQAIGAELQALSALQDETSMLADLKPWVEAPPSQSALVQDFARLFPALVKAIPAPADESLSQRVLRQLKSMVHWRRLDQPDTTDPESLLQLINLALHKGQNEEAARLIRTVPAPLQPVITPLQRALTQRLEALKAAETFLQTAMAQLNRTAQSKGGAQ
jgi:hypothetical protein